MKVWNKSTLKTKLWEGREGFCATLRPAERCRKMLGVGGLGGPHCLCPHLCKSPCPLPALSSHGSFQSWHRSIPLTTTTSTSIWGWAANLWHWKDGDEKNSHHLRGVSVLAFLCLFPPAKSLTSLLSFSASHAGMCLLCPVSLTSGEGSFLQRDPSSRGSLLCSC